MPRYVVQRRYTRDARIPLVAGDDEFLYGWQQIPLPPALDEGWEIFDTSKDRRTGWERIRYVEDDDGKSPSYPFPDEGSIPKRPVKYKQMSFDFLDR
jgi:hypothetical protein